MGLNRNIDLGFRSNQYNLADISQTIKSLVYRAPCTKLENYERKKLHDEHFKCSEIIRSIFMKSKMNALLGVAS